MAVDFSKASDSRESQRHAQDGLRGLLKSNLGSGIPTISAVFISLEVSHYTWPSLKGRGAVTQGCEYQEAGLTGGHHTLSATVPSLAPGGVCPSFHRFTPF